MRVERDSRSNDEYGREVRRLLEQTIRDELAIVAGIEGVDLTDETLDRFAWAVLTRVDYGFRYRWAPEWTPPDEPHTWTEAEQIYARCVMCLAISPPTTSVEAARRWYTDHRGSAHIE